MFECYTLSSFNVGFVDEIIHYKYRFTHHTCLSVVQYPASQPLPLPAFTGSLPHSKTFKPGTLPVAVTHSPGMETGDRDQLGLEEKVRKWLEVSGKKSELQAKLRAELYGAIQTEIAFRFVEDQVEHNSHSYYLEETSI